MGLSFSSGKGGSLVGKKVGDNRDSGLSAGGSGGNLRIIRASIGSCSGFSPRLLGLRPSRTLSGCQGVICFVASAPRQTDTLLGQMAEWSNAHAWKACEAAMSPRVRIPLCPPDPRPSLLVWGLAFQEGREYRQAQRSRVRVPLFFRKESKPSNLRRRRFTLRTTRAERG